MTVADARIDDTWSDHAMEAAGVDRLLGGEPPRT